MSLAEIKTAVRRLTPAELTDLEQLVAELRQSLEAGPHIRVVHPSDPDVPAAMDEIFETHRELFHRLAQ